MTTFLRAAALTNFDQIARECGLNTRALVEQVGLSARCLSEPDLKLPTSSVTELLELAAHLANEPAFGLRMAVSRRLSNLGLLGLLLRDQPTLKDALQVLVTYLHTHTEALSVSLVKTGDVVIIREETPTHGSAPISQAIEMAMGSIFRVLQLFLGDKWSPRMVTFQHPEPSSTHLHRSVFGQHIAFGQEFNDIICHAKDLDAQNHGADPIMARYSKRLLEQELNANAKMSERVRHLIVLLLPRGHCRVEVVALHLGVDRRTISNHLYAEGTSFKTLVNQIRTDLLIHYRKSGSKTLSEITPLLGFSEPSAFSRWHKNLFNAKASHLLKST